MVLTRLAQNVPDSVTKKPLALKMYYDENPPDKGHWTYKMFKLKVDPDNNQPLADPNDYAFMQVNPSDNLENLPASYIKQLESMPARLRKRFLEGEFRETAPNALFADEVFDRWRLIDGELPEMLRIVVAIDPSGAEDEDNIDNDEIGIVIAGLGIDGNGYCLADLTCKAGPSTWGRIAVQAFINEGADRVVGEVNFGGAMVGFVIKAAAKEQKVVVPFRSITASRGKTVRAEPLSSLCESGKFRMAGIFRELEDEACGFTTHGYTGDHSPNRMDALVWAASDLFPELMKTKEEKPPEPVILGGFRQRSSTDWMYR
jgi:phage terminase large subunit-like protein